MIVGFSQQIPYKWNNVLTCAIGAILLLATCSLIGIILLVSLRVSHRQHLQQQQQQQIVFRKDSGGSSREISHQNNNYYGTPCSTTPTSTLNYSTPTTTASSSFSGVPLPSDDAFLATGLKCAIAFSWVLPTLYCVILFLVRHVMRTFSATWWLKLGSVECNLLIVNQLLLAVLFYLVCGVLVRRLRHHDRGGGGNRRRQRPKALEQKFSTVAGGGGGGGVSSSLSSSTSSSAGQSATSASSSSRRYVAGVEGGNCRVTLRRFAVRKKSN